MNLFDRPGYPAPDRRRRRYVPAEAWAGWGDPLPVEALPRRRFAGWPHLSAVLFNRHAAASASHDAVVQHAHDAEIDAILAARA